MANNNPIVSASQSTAPLPAINPLLAKYLSKEVATRNLQIQKTSTVVNLPLPQPTLDQNLSGTSSIQPVKLQAEQNIYDEFAQPLQDQSSTQPSVISLSDTASSALISMMDAAAEKTQDLLSSDEDDGSITPVQNTDLLGTSSPEERDNPLVRSPVLDPTGHTSCSSCAGALEECPNCSRADYSSADMERLRRLHQGIEQHLQESLSSQDSALGSPSRGSSLDQPPSMDSSAAESTAQLSYGPNSDTGCAPGTILPQMS